VHRAAEADPGPQRRLDVADHQRLGAEPDLAVEAREPERHARFAEEGPVDRAGLYQHGGRVARIPVLRQRRQLDLQPGVGREPAARVVAVGDPVARRLQLVHERVVPLLGLHAEEARRGGARRDDQEEQHQQLFHSGFLTTETQRHRDGGDRLNSRMPAPCDAGTRGNPSLCVSAPLWLIDFGEAAAETRD